MKSKRTLHIVRMGTLPRELMVGISGAVLVLFILAHLAGNFFLFYGPEAYNAYADHLHSLGPLLWVARFGLLTAFFTHVFFTIWLTMNNRAARKTRYAVSMKASETNFAKKTMIYTGLMLFAFIAFHIYDFALSDPEGPRSIANYRGSEESLGLYGVVWNSFANPVRSLIYILALCTVGIHFSSAVATIWMTFGLLPAGGARHATRVAQILGAVVAFAFISIPLYVLTTTYLDVLTETYLAWSSY